MCVDMNHTPNTPAAQAGTPISYAELLALLKKPIHEKVWLDIPAVEYSEEVYHLEWEVAPPEPEWPDGRTYYFVTDPDGKLIDDTYMLLGCDSWDLFAHLCNGGWIAAARRRAKRAAERAEGGAE